MLQLTEGQRQRFFAKVDKIPNGCWLWTRTLTERGYGFYRVNKQNYRCHRLVYQLYKGDIPKGLEIDHLCRVRNCVNPDHLEAVTHKMNLLRGETFTAENANKLTCPKGHYYTVENTYLHKYSGGWVGRDCKTCVSQRGRERLLKKNPNARQNKNHKQKAS